MQSLYTTSPHVPSFTGLMGSVFKKDAASFDEITDETSILTNMMLNEEDYVKANYCYWPSRTVVLLTEFKQTSVVFADVG